MVIKVYVSSQSGNKEVKKRQQRVLMILDSKSVKYDVIDITEPGRDADKEFMQTNSKAMGATIGDPTPRHPLPPQLFNDEEYCGDYDQFDLANEIDKLEEFLKLEPLTTEDNGLKVKQPEAVNDSDVTKDADKSQLNGNSESESAEVTVNGVKSRSNSKESSPAETKTEKSRSHSKEGSPAATKTEVIEAEITTENKAEIESDKAEESESKSEISSAHQSKEPSQEKETEKTPSELMIESEKTADE